MTENITSTERIADYSPPDLPRPTTLDGWTKRAEMICTKGTKDIIEKTELEYFPFGEAARAIEVFKPWLTEGLTKSVWVESRSGLRNCCIAHWNQCARLWDHIDSWEKAKERFQTRNGDWRPAHSSSPLFAQDLLDDYRDRSLPPPPVPTEEEKQAAKEARAIKAAVKAGLIQQPAPKGSGEQPSVAEKPTKLWENLSAEEAITISTRAEIAEQERDEYGQELSVARDQLNAARDLIVRQDRRIKELGGVSVLPLEMQQWLTTIGDPEPDPDPDPNPDEPTTAPAPVINSVINSALRDEPTTAPETGAEPDPDPGPQRADHEIAPVADRAEAEGTGEKSGDKPAKKRGRPPSAKTVAKNARVAARTAKLKAAMG